MPKVLLPLVAALAVGGAAAGGGVYLATRGETVEEVSPPAVQATATPTPTSTPTTTAEPTAAAEPTATPTPDSTAGKAPKGCTADELAYVDPDGRFAFCYPADMTVSTVDTGAGTTAANVADPDEKTDNAVTAVFGLIAEPYEVCGGALDISPTVIKNEGAVDLTIGGINVEACYREHYYPAEPDVLWYKALDLMVETSGGQPVIVLVTYRGPDFAVAEPEAMRILDSVTLY